MNKNQNFFPKNLKFLRKKNGETQTSIGLHVKKLPTAISSWETQQSSPSISDSIAISDYFGVFVGDMIGRDLSVVGISPLRSNAFDVGDYVGIDVGISTQKGQNAEVADFKAKYYALLDLLATYLPNILSNASPPPGAAAMLAAHLTSCKTTV